MNHNADKITDIIKGEGQARKNWLSFGYAQDSERKGKRTVALFNEI